MYDFILKCILLVCFLGWIPIIALCKGIAWIIDACHSEYIGEEENTNSKKSPNVANIDTSDIDYLKEKTINAIKS